MKSIYDARASGNSAIDLANYFSEYSLGQKAKTSAFRRIGFGMILEGRIKVKDGGTPIKAVISINLDQYHSIVPRTPNSDQGEGKDPLNGYYFFYKYNFEGSGGQGYMGLQIKGYVPDKSTNDRFHTFIWGR